MQLSALPGSVNWDLTYACPLRCSHCYSESGRRPARQLARAEMLRLAAVIAAMRPQSVQFSGGEPLLVKELPEIAEEIAKGGALLGIYLSGFGLNESIARFIAGLFTWIHISLDGADAATHDFIRGRSGAFDDAMAALSLFDRVAAERRQAGHKRLNFGIDCALIQSNVHQLERFCTEIVPLFPRLRFLNLQPAVPSGLAAGEAYAERELLTEQQMEALREDALARRLRSLTPHTVDEVSVSSSFVRQLDPARPNDGPVMIDLMHVEPDGLVRGIPLYEGTVGNLLHESPEVIWRRVQERHTDPFVIQALAGVRTMREWAAAARRIEQQFASEPDRLRISRRKDHAVVTLAPRQRPAAR